jgi:thiamine biosynthesis lipoprotein
MHVQSAAMTDLGIERAASYWICRFRAMASPCEILVDTGEESLARRLGALARDEALRVERKFSRYRDDNIVHRINSADGAAVKVDEETAALLDYADACWRLSGGLFDITSGVLRRAWRFDGGEGVPGSASVAVLLPQVGWERVRWQKPVLSLPAGMEIDFGGLGKEYAVDRCAGLLAAATASSVVVNFGGDLACTGPRRDGHGWVIGVDDPHGIHVGSAGAREARLAFELSRGGIATSGDTRRFVLRDGRRYGHILDPRTGWPVTDAPRSVTVAGNTCTEAGILATLAMLHGAGAERFLESQGGVRYWCLR